MCGENHILMQKVYLLSKVCASNFNGQIACLSFVISVPWNLWGIFGSFAIFDEKYCSHSVTGYNFQAESGSSCDLKETKKVNTIRCWREMPPACRRRPLRVHGCLLKWCRQWGLPGGTVIRNLSASTGDVVQSPIQEDPWSRKWQVASLFWPENSTERSLAGPQSQLSDRARTYTRGLSSTCWIHLRALIW